MIKYWSEKNVYGCLREFSFNVDKNILEVVCYGSNYNYKDFCIDIDGGPYLSLGSIFKKDNINVVIDKIISHVKDKNGNLFVKMETHNL
jgi:hypothetical protein